MPNIKTILQKACLTVRSYFPQQVPTGMTAFKDYADKVYCLTGPIADQDSIKFALASQIIHADASRSNPPMQYFVRRLIKTAANQVASEVFQEIKLAQQAKIAAANAAAITTTAIEGAVTASSTTGAVTASTPAAVTSGSGQQQ